VELVGVAEVAEDSVLDPFRAVLAASYFFFAAPYALFADLALSPLRAGLGTDRGHSVRLCVGVLSRWGILNVIMH
jgi:hypothetical protein